MRKIGNIRTGMPQPSYGGSVKSAPISTSSSAGLRKIGNIKTGITAKRPVAPRPDIKQSVNYKNAVLNADKYKQESDAANANVDKWQQRAGMPKEALKMVARSALGIGDVMQRLNPVEFGRNIDAGIKKVFTGDKNVPASLRFQQGRTERQARPLMWEQFTGKSVTKKEGGIDWEQGRKFIGDAASAPTYAYSGAKAFLGNPTGNIASRIAKRYIGSVPEAALNTGIQQFQQGDLKNVGRNMAMNTAIMGTFGNVLGEGGRAIRKVSDAVSPVKAPEIQSQPVPTSLPVGLPQGARKVGNVADIMAPKMSEVTVGSRVKTADRNNIGTVVGVNADGRARVHFISKEKGEATVDMPIAGLTHVGGKKGKPTPIGTQETLSNPPTYSQTTQNPLLQEAGSTPRGYTETLKADPTVPKAVYEDIPGYAKSTDKSVFEAVAPEVGANPRGVMDELLQKGTNLTREESAKAQLLLKKFIADGDMESAKLIARRTSTSATETARALEILSAHHKLTPEGAFRDALKIVDDYNKKNPTSPVDLTPEKASEIQALAEKVQGLDPATREWQVAAAMLEKAKGEITPVSLLGKISKFQTIMQLLNPKTLIRNLGGNTAMDVMEDASRVVGTGIDKALYSLGFIKDRNMVMPNLKTNWMNKMTGFKMGVEDANLGIRTSGSAGKYDIIQDAFKEGTVMHELEKTLGKALGAPDKAFYHGRYMSSLENIMKAKGVDTPTPIMRDMADAEALYATFQNNSAIAQALSTAKRGANFGKEWGLGDLLLKYPKTPGNIVSAGLDYSPIGFVKGLKQFHDSVKMLDPAKQREAILNLGRGITGSGLIFGGAMMAKNGIITADPETDPDIRQIKREAGQGPFSMNLSSLGRFFSGGDTKIKKGDTIINYDWLQPNAIQLSMGANMVLNKKGDDQINAALATMAVGFDTINEQPIFSGIKRFATNLDSNRGGGPAKAVSELLSGAPSSLTPSALNQVGQMTDNTARDTYDPNFMQSMLNKVKGRVPGFREDLQPRIGTLGQTMETYQNGGNNFFNVFLNPSFTRTYDLSPVAQEVIDIYTRSGETKQAPRIAPKKLKIDGESYQLSPQQYTQYQTFIGKNTDAEFQKLLQDPEFQAMNDGQKADAMSSVLTKVGQAGREELAQTGVLPKSSEQQAKDFLRVGDVDKYRDFVLEHPELNTKADFTRLMNELKKEGYNEQEKAQYEDILKMRKQKTNRPFYIP